MTAGPPAEFTLDRNASFLNYAATRGLFFLAIGPAVAVVASLLSGSHSKVAFTPMDSFAVRVMDRIGMIAPLQSMAAGCMGVSKPVVTLACKFACVVFSGYYCLRIVLARTDDQVCERGHNICVRTHIHKGLHYSATKLFSQPLFPVLSAGTCHLVLKVHTLCDITPEEWLSAIASSVFLGFMLGRLVTSILSPTIILLDDWLYILFFAFTLDRSHQSKPSFSEPFPFCLPPPTVPQLPKGFA